MSKLRLDLSRVPDDGTRSSLRSIQDAVNASPMSEEFQFMEIILDGGLTNHLIAHNLGVIPKDIITTKSVGSYTWNYEKFTKEHLSIDTGSIINIRCLIGRID